MHNEQSNRIRRFYAHNRLKPLYSRFERCELEPGLQHDGCTGQDYQTFVLALGRPQRLLHQITNTSQYCVRVLTIFRVNSCITVTANGPYLLIGPAICLVRLFLGAF